MVTSGFKNGPVDYCLSGKVEEARRGVEKVTTKTTTMMMMKDDSVLKEMEERNLQPRLCYLTKGERGYGFHLHGERSSGAQFIRRIEAGSPAELAGLRSGDRVVEVNGENVEKEVHQQVSSATLPEVLSLSPSHSLFLIIRIFLLFFTTLVYFYFIFSSLLLSLLLFSNLLLSSFHFLSPLFFLFFSHLSSLLFSSHPISCLTSSLLFFFYSRFFSSLCSLSSDLFSSVDFLFSSPFFSFHFLPHVFTSFFLFLFFLLLFSYLVDFSFRFSSRLFSFQRKCCYTNQHL